MGLNGLELGDYPTKEEQCRRREPGGTTVDCLREVAVSACQAPLVKDSSGSSSVPIGYTIAQTLEAAADGL
jgi:hypothetical protein